jgi:hypothetical protein
MQVVLVSVRMSWQNAMMLYKKKFDQNKPFYVVYQRQRSRCTPLCNTTLKGDILFIHGEADDVTLLSDMITVG